MREIIFGESYLSGTEKKFILWKCSVDKTQVLFIALPGASAVNINKNTIHAALKIPVG